VILQEIPARQPGSRPPTRVRCPGRSQPGVSLHRAELHRPREGALPLQARRLTTTGWNDAEPRARRVLHERARAGRYRFVVAATLDPRHWTRPETATRLRGGDSRFLETRWAYLCGAHPRRSCRSAASSGVWQRGPLRRLAGCGSASAHLGSETRTNELRLAKECARGAGARDLTAANAQLEQLSKLDSLTGVHNRRSLRRRHRGRVAKGEAAWGTPLSLDDPETSTGSWKFNRPLRHPRGGDECLPPGVVRNFHPRLFANAWPTSSVARYGGEERGSSSSSRTPGSRERRTWPSASGLAKSRTSR
jgi:hypothetical protein